MKNFLGINFTQIFRICQKMLQFLTYLLHKQIIEMSRSQKFALSFFGTQSETVYMEFIALKRMYAISLLEEYKGLTVHTVCTE